jgi:pimeloyl-ACP methyl ester carboxylesterase
VETHKITGGGSVQLHVVETGNKQGRPVLFLHGVSQSFLTWNLQMSSSLADAHRLVAMDLRGHGLSDKPHDAYTDSKLWADDINAVIQSLDLDHPLCMGSDNFINAIL